jgi:hypothetical protein
MAEPMNLGSGLLERLRQLTAAETDRLIGYLTVIAPEAVATAIDQVIAWRAETTPTVGGPDIGHDAETEFRIEKTDSKEHM